MIAGHKCDEMTQTQQSSVTVSLHLLAACAVRVQAVTPSVCTWRISHPLFSLNRTDASFPQTPETQTFVQPRRLLLTKCTLTQPYLRYPKLLEVV